jgi:CHAT domain-containing protein
LTSGQILKMDWSRCQLAVLSACWTASGEGRAFANPQSLVQAFLSAGARGVVAPAWAIDSGAAAQWMREFYAAMRRGAEPPAAVRAASRHLAGQQRFARPYYWAGFEYFI